MLGVQGARGRRACLGRAGVARRRHGRWAARARGALERAGARGRRWRARQASGRQGAGPGRAWVRLVHWLGQFGAHAASLGFDLGF